MAHDPALAKRLAAARAAADEVSVRRRLPFCDPLSGFMVEMGTAWAVLALSIDGWVDGYSAFRLVDVKSVERTPADRSVTARVLRATEEWPVRGVDGFDCTSARSMIQSAIDQQEVLEIREEELGDAMWVVKPMRFTRRNKLRARSLEPDAAWGDVITVDLHDLTLVRFRTRYLRALLTVAGDPPPDTPYVIAACNGLSTPHAPTPLQTCLNWPRPDRLARLQGLVRT